MHTTPRDYGRLAILAIALSSVACGEDDLAQDGRFSAAELEIISGMSPLPDLQDDPTNRYANDPAAAALGQKLFFETRYSGPVKVADDGENGGLGAEGTAGLASCAGCHVPATDFYDTRSVPNNVSLSISYTTRNTPSLVNVAYYDWYGWGGKQDSLWTQASGSPESGANTGGNRCGYAHVLWDLYRDEYDAIFDNPLPEGLGTGAFPEACKPKKNADDPDGAWEAMSEEDQLAINWVMASSGKAIAAYERLLVSRDAPFDRFVAGDETAIDESAKRGLELFIGKAACADCHEGPNFTDQEFHNTGVPQAVGPHVPEEDEGRFKDGPSATKHTFNSGSIFSDAPEVGRVELEGVEASDRDLGAFRTKSLRNVDRSPPYMHNGSFATLRDVVDFYDAGGGQGGYLGQISEKLEPLNLTEQEKDDLVAFLQTLTGQPLPAELTTRPQMPE